MQKLILASASPRRRELLAMAGFRFEVMPADVDETPDPTLTPAQQVLALAKKKALHIQGLVGMGPETAVIGADTLVDLDGQALGKPASTKEACEMLTRLAGRFHLVHTGVALSRNGQLHSFVESAKVFFRPLTEAEIRAYVATGEPMDKAGAYGIQERGALLVSRVEGDFFTVMGLPLCRLAMALQA